jgi:hypothetical protein
MQCNMSSRLTPTFLVTRCGWRGRGAGCCLLGLRSRRSDEARARPLQRCPVKHPRRAGKWAGAGRITRPPRAQNRPGNSSLEMSLAPKAPRCADDLSVERVANRRQSREFIQLLPSQIEEAGRRLSIDVDWERKYQTCRKRMRVVTDRAGVVHVWITPQRPALMPPNAARARAFQGVPPYHCHASNHSAVPSCTIPSTHPSIFCEAARQRTRSWAQT